MGEPVVKLQKVSKRFGQVEALHKVDLEVIEGEILGLVGPDGAGKTTTMRIICGLMLPDEGRVCVLGRSADKVKEGLGVIGYMPQGFGLYGDLTVMENIYFFGAMYRLDRSTVRKRAHEILEITGLAPFQSRLADALSGGMKQKLALTCAIIASPKILILDEPTCGVDPLSRREFWRLLYSLNQEGVTIIVSTPYMDEAELCSRVAFIQEGSIKRVDNVSGLSEAFPYRIIQVRCDCQDPHVFDDLEGIEEVSFYGDRYHLAVMDLERVYFKLPEYLSYRGILSYTAEEIRPSMEDYFVFFAEGGR